MGGKVLPKFCGLKENDFALTPKETRGLQVASRVGLQEITAVSSAASEVWGPEWPSPLECGGGPRCSQSCSLGNLLFPCLGVKYSQAHRDFFGQEASKAPGRKTVYRLSLTHFPVHFPSWLNWIMSGRPGAARGHSQVSHREAVKGSVRRTGPGQPHFLAPGLLSKGQTSHSSPLPAFLSFHPGVREITGPKAPPGAGRISTSFAFENLLGLARTSQQGMLRVKQRFA